MFAAYITTCIGETALMNKRGTVYEMQDMRSHKEHRDMKWEREQSETIRHLNRYLRKKTDGASFTWVRSG